VSGLAWPARYEIRVDGVLDVRWADWFGGLRVENNGSQTVIVGVLADQPALHGVLAQIRDLGLCLLSVRRIDRLTREVPATAQRARQTSEIRQPGQPRVTRPPPMKKPAARSRSPIPNRRGVRDAVV
jgi:hypothetical protein